MEKRGKNRQNRKTGQVGGSFQETRGEMSSADKIVSRIHMSKGHLGTGTREKGRRTGMGKSGEGLHSAEHPVITDGEGDMGRKLRDQVQLESLLHLTTGKRGGGEEKRGGILGFLSPHGKSLCID